MGEPRCSYVVNALVLPAATPVTVDVEINHARFWMILVKNVGANPLTGISVARIPLNNLVENPAALTVSLPLAADATYTAIDGDGEPVQKFRLILTSTLGTSVTINAAGD